MLTSRREFLSAAGVAAYTAFSQQLFAANPTLGLIFPPENYPIPPDAKQLYPSGVGFIGNGVGLPGGMTIEGYEEAIPRVLPTGQANWRSRARCRLRFRLVADLLQGREVPRRPDPPGRKGHGHAAPRRKATACLMVFSTANAKRVALATAYTDIVTERLEDFPPGVWLRGNGTQRSGVRITYRKAPRRTTSS